MKNKDYKKLIFILFCLIKSAFSEFIFNEGITVNNSLYTNNPITFENTVTSLEGINATGNITIDGTIQINVSQNATGYPINIGNNKTKITIYNLPTTGVGQNFLVISPETNQLFQYSSPSPEPENVTVDTLEVDTIFGNSNSVLLINPNTGSTTIGNTTGNVTFEGSQIKIDGIISPPSNNLDNTLIIKSNISFNYLQSENIASENLNIGINNKKNCLILSKCTFNGIITCLGSFSLDSTTINFSTSSDCTFIGPYSNNQEIIIKPKQNTNLEIKFPNSFPIINNPLFYMIINSLNKVYKADLTKISTISSNSFSVDTLSSIDNTIANQKILNIGTNNNKDIKINLFDIDQKIATQYFSRLIANNIMGKSLTFVSESNEKAILNPTSQESTISFGFNETNNGITFVDNLICTNKLKCTIDSLKSVVTNFNNSVIFKISQQAKTSDYSNTYFLGINDQFLTVKVNTVSNDFLNQENVTKLKNTFEETIKPKLFQYKKEYCLDNALNNQQKIHLGLLAEDLKNLTTENNLLCFNEEGNIIDYNTNLLTKITKQKINFLTYQLENEEFLILDQYLYDLVTHREELSLILEKKNEIINKLLSIKNKIQS